MNTRREMIKAVIAVPTAVALSTTTTSSEANQTQKRLVLPENTIRQLEEVMKSGAVITCVKVYHSTPRKPGWSDKGWLLLEEKDVVGCKIE